MNKNIILVRGNLYTNMPFNPNLLSKDGPIIHVKKDVIFGVWMSPNNIKTWDEYMDINKFKQRFGKLPSNIIAFSNIFKK